MNKEIAKKWVEALRSGNYKQGHCQLRSTDNKYCCLGVLCDLYTQATGAQWIRKDRAEYQIHFDSKILSPSVREWSGMQSTTGRYENLDTCDKTDLTVDNDYGKTFQEIADIIEKHMEDL